MSLLLTKEQISDAKKGHTAIIELHPSVYEDDYAIAEAQLAHCTPLIDAEWVKIIRKELENNKTLVEALKERHKIELGEAVKQERERIYKRGDKLVHAFRVDAHSFWRQVKYGRDTKPWGEEGREWIKKQSLKGATE